MWLHTCFRTSSIFLILDFEVIRWITLLIIKVSHVILLITFQSILRILKVFPVTPEHPLLYTVWITFIKTPKKPFSNNVAVKPLDSEMDCRWLPSWPPSFPPQTAASWLWSHCRVEPGCESETQEQHWDNDINGTWDRLWWGMSEQSEQNKDWKSSVQLKVTTTFPVSSAFLQGKGSSKIYFFNPTQA